MIIIDFEQRDGTINNNTDAGIVRVSGDIWDETFEFGDSWCNPDFGTTCGDTVPPEQPSQECIDALEDWCNDIWFDFCGNCLGTDFSAEEFLANCQFDACAGCADLFESDTFTYNDAIAEGCFETTLSTCSDLCEADTTLPVGCDDTIDIDCTVCGDPHFTTWYVSICAFVFIMIWIWKKM